MKTFKNLSKIYEILILDNKHIILLLMPYIFIISTIFVLNTSGLASKISKSILYKLYKPVNFEKFVFIEVPVIYEKKSDIKTIIQTLHIEEEDSKEEIIISDVESNLPQYKIMYIYIGATKKFVMIDKKLYKEGDILEYKNENIEIKEKIIKITKKGILLKSKRGKRWIYIK